MEEYRNDNDPVGALLGLLRDRRRRLVIDTLRNRPKRESVPIEELASTIVLMETDGEQPWADANGAGSGVPPASEEDNGIVTERVLISLVHIHLPKLHENDLVDYDAANGTVRATHPPEEFWERLRSHQQFSDGLTAPEVD